MQERAWANANGWVALVAAAAVSPALLPGGEAWLDNPRRVLEVWSLRHSVLPENGFGVGWSTLADGGFPVGVDGAPLGPLAVALLGLTGLPVVGLWMAAIPLANVAFALGALRLARATLRSAGAAVIAALIAVCASTDLWAAGGVAAGAWPTRLALGLLAAGLGSPRRAEAPHRIGAWMATLLLLDLRTGALGLLWLGLQTETRWRDRVTGVAIGLLGSAFGWAPRVGAALDSNALEWTPLWTLLALVVPVDTGALQRGQAFAVIGGPLGLLGSLPILGGLVALVWARPRRDTWIADPVRVRRLAVLGLVVGLLSAVVLPLLGARSGLSPWAWLPIIRLLLAMLAAAGWRAIGGGRRSVLVIGAPIVALAAGVGISALPLRLSAGDAAVWGALDRTWAALAAAAPEGRVLHEDPAWNAAGPPLLRRAPVAALSPLWTGVAIGPAWADLAPSGVTESPAILQTWLTRYGIGALVTVTPETAAALAAAPGTRLLRAEAPFAAWLVTGPVPDELAIPADRGRIDGIVVRRETIDGALRATGTAPVPFRARRTWDRGWEARLDGALIAVHRDEQTGFIAGVTRGSGHLALRWRAPGRWGRSASALGLVLGLLAGRRARQRGSGVD